MKDSKNRCGSCGKTWIQHPGITLTCEELQHLKRVISGIKEALSLPRMFGDKYNCSAMREIEKILSLE